MYILLTNIFYSVMGLEVCWLNKYVFRCAWSQVMSKHVKSSQLSCHCLPRNKYGMHDLTSNNLTRFYITRRGINKYKLIILNILLILYHRSRYCPNLAMGLVFEIFNPANCNSENWILEIKYTNIKRYSWKQYIH